MSALTGSLEHDFVGRVRDHLRASSRHLSSITGAGLRAVLADVAERLPIEIHHVPTGTQVFDWTVPKEWVIREAWMRTLDGTSVADIREHPLHVLNYSAPIKGRFSLSEMAGHLFTKPELPNAIPYRTSYYNENWGICISEATLSTLTDDAYDVFIDSEFIHGATSYGEIVIPGTSDREILITTHVCHPGTANDNLTGIAVLTELGRLLRTLPPLRHTVRLLFIPGTIGSLCWLSANQDRLSKIDHGMVITGLGDTGPLTWKRTRRGDTPIDCAFDVVLTASSGHEHTSFMDFYPYGYDERQFCSPGFNLPVGRLSRGVHGEYPEYHTSLDNDTFVNNESLLDSFAALREVIDVLERDCVPTNLLPFGEPQLGRRGLYGAIGGAINRQSAEMAMLWVLNLADGQNSLVDMAKRTGMSFAALADITEILRQHEIVSTSPPPVARESSTKGAP